jgi:hypothetical protein
MATPLGKTTTWIDFIGSLFPMLDRPGEIPIPLFRQFISQETRFLLSIYTHHTRTVSFTWSVRSAVGR